MNYALAFDVRYNKQKRIKMIMLATKKNNNNNKRLELL